MSDVLTKIKNLLDLSKSDNQNEAALALSKAKQLMDKYEVNEADLIISNIKEAVSLSNNAKKSNSYLLALADSIATLFDCQFYGFCEKYEETGRYKNYFVFVGFNPHQEICKYSFDVLSQKLKKARKNYLESIKDQRNKTKRADAFAFGWSTAIIDKVKELIPEKEIQENKDSNERGLLAYSLIDQYIESQTIDDAAIKEVDWDNNRSDVQNGMIEGEKIEIHKGVDLRDHTMITD